MLSIFKVRFLCYLQSRIKQDHQPHSSQGLTLIELLVVIVIIGILAAIASSTFLNATARAKESEAKVNVATMLKAQQMYYTENNEFARNLNALELGISERTKYYSYKTHEGGGNHVDRAGNQVNVFIAIAEPQEDLRGYMGKVWFDSFTSSGSLKSVACEGGIRETYFMNGLTYCD